MIKVSTCGYNSKHQKPCNIEHENGLPEYLLLIVKTPAWFISKGKKVITEPNMVIIFPPNSYIHYGSYDSNYNDDWIHFKISGSESKQLFSALSLPLNQPIWPAQTQILSHYIQLMTNTLRSESFHSVFILDSLMHALLYTLDTELMKAKDPRCSHKHYASFSRLRTEIYNNPSTKWNVNKATKSLYLSVSYFQHLYKDFFQCSFQQDVIQARLQLAEFYLINSNMSIRSLAEYCGYDNELHFMRQFKKFKGLTPSEFRKISAR